nr:hypothetical protein [Tanacetum cinerariifolium]
MDPYEEVTQQGQVPPLSPAYVPDPIELDEHVPVYVPGPEHPEYHAPSDDDIQTIARAADRAEDVGYEVCQAYLSSEALNRALLARLETLKTHMSHMKWQHQSAKDLAVTQMMGIHTLEAKARTDTVEDIGSSC